VGPRAGLEVVENRNISCSSRIIHVHTMHWPTYRMTSNIRQYPFSDTVEKNMAITNKAARATPIYSGRRKEAVIWFSLDNEYRSETVQLFYFNLR
jgi:hypothetical protein